MKFGFLTGAATGGSKIGYDASRADDPTYRRHDLRYNEAVEEMVFAEKMGFDLVGLPEQHFAPDVCATSAPEVIFGAVAALTSRIRLRAMISLPLFPMNHPIRVAEQAATIDILSHGRYEIGTGRSNQPLQLEAFNVPPEKTRQLWHEGMQLMTTALASAPGRFEFHGEFFDIPPRTFVPAPVQRPHPPVLVATSSVDGHQNAGAASIGAMSFANFSGFDTLEAFKQAYDDAFGTGEPVGQYPLRYMSVLAMPSICAPTRAEAQQTVKDYVTVFGGVVDISYLQLASKSADYAYMDEAAKKMREKLTDLDYLAEESGTAVIGDPKDCIRQLQRYERMGIDEVILGIDGMPHAKVMQSLELLGKFVLPSFRGSERSLTSRPGPAAAAAAAAL
jgi:alkanesulfonate monooxygenase SsuD/methylene tetrahydromethanopterin reductase-like flavin-dependent oxidoreductase (luciferase family)